MIETWKENLNKCYKIGVLFMHLSNLLIAKLEAYGFVSDSLIFIKDYLTNRFQCCKIGDSISNSRKIKTGVSQGSILGPILLIYLLMTFYYLLKAQPYAIMQMTALFILALNILDLFIKNLTLILLFSKTGTLIIT